MSTTATSSQRKANFSAGPAVLPEPVLARVRDEMMCLPGRGASILEISHRNKPHSPTSSTTASSDCGICSNCPRTTRSFLQGGARLQFSMVPMNLCGHDRTADYVVTGSWGQMACARRP